VDYAYPFLWYFVFIISVTVHEAAHAWAAKLGGDLTAYAGGQVSLNPYSHMKRAPFGMVILPIITAIGIGWPFGYATTPFDPDWAYNHPRKAAWMAAAGPAANLLIVIICYVLVQAGIGAGIFLQPDSVGYRHIVDANIEGGWSGITLFISMLFTINLIMVVLNLIPLPPLDGSSVITLFLHDDTARNYRTVISNPMFSLAGLVLAWFVFSPLFHLVFLFIINIFYWGAAYGR
jgi:Zn-dependent protease